MTYKIARRREPGDEVLHGMEDLERPIIPERDVLAIVDNGKSRRT